MVESTALRRTASLAFRNNIYSSSQRSFCNRQTSETWGARDIGFLASMGSLAARYPSGGRLKCMHMYVLRAAFSQ